MQRDEIVDLLNDLEYIQKLKRVFDVDIFKFSNHSSEEQCIMMITDKDSFKCTEDALILLYERLIYEDESIPYIEFVSGNKEVFYHKYIYPYSDGFNVSAISFEFFREEFIDVIPSIDVNYHDYIINRISGAKLFEVRNEWNSQCAFGICENWYFIYYWYGMAFKGLLERYFGK